jgi:hypothetical protein
MKKSHKHILIAVVIVVIIIFVVGVGSVALGPGITTSKDTPDGMKWSWKSNLASKKASFGVTPFP